MKNNLEDIFKHHLKNYEASYDSSAWDQLQSKLDARKTPAQQGVAGKIILIIATVAAVSVGTYFIVNEFNSPQNSVDTEINRDATEQSKDIQTNPSDSNQNRETNNQQATEDLEIVNKQEVIVKNQPAKTESTLVSNDLINQKDKEAITEQKEGITTTETIDENKDNKTSSIRSNTDKIVLSNDTKETLVSSEDNSDKSIEPLKSNAIVGVISQNEICSGDLVAISNNGNKNQIVRIQFEDKFIEINQGKNVELNLNESQTFEFLDEKGNVIGTSSVTVHKMPQTDFTMRSNIYEDGLPVIHLETYGNYKEIEWDLAGLQTLLGKEVQAHIFDKGNYNITLKVTDFNGCSMEKRRSVRIKENYNLMAMNAFKPNDADPRNKAFIPFSLTQRDVNFTLSIIDPNENSVIYTSSNVKEPWDGIDRRTGKMTPAGKVYIWKVQIDNPLPNERPIYAGTVIHH